MVPYLTSVRKDTASLLPLREISQNKPSQIRGIKPLSSWHIKKGNILHLESHIVLLLNNFHFSCGVLISADILCHDHHSAHAKTAEKHKQQLIRY